MRWTALRITTSCCRLAVLEELDGLKKAEGERGANARAAIRALEWHRCRGDLLEGVPLESGGTLRVESNCVDVTLPESLSDSVPGQPHPARVQGAA